MPLRRLHALDPTPRRRRRRPGLLRRRGGEVRHQQDPRAAQAHASARHPAARRDGQGGDRVAGARRLRPAAGRHPAARGGLPHRRSVPQAGREGRGQRGAHRRRRARGPHQRDRHLRVQAGEDGRAPGVGREEEEDRHQGHLLGPAGARARAHRTGTHRGTRRGGPAVRPAHRGRQRVLRERVQGQRQDRRAGFLRAAARTVPGGRGGRPAPPPP